MLYLCQKPPRFEPRRQVDNSLSIRFAGTGLGLALAVPADGIARGLLTIESTPAFGGADKLEQTDRG